MNSPVSSPQSDSGQQDERFDGIDRYYAPIEKCDRAAALFFWGAALLSVVTLFADRFIPWVPYREYPAVLFAIFVTANLFTTLFLRFHLIPIAERKRRKQLLSDAFGVPLTPEETRKYYNNAFSSSLTRLGANVMENAFFAKNVVAEMVKTERLRVAFYGAAWMAAVLLRSTDLGVIGIITQIVFSAEVVGRWLSIEFLRRRNEEIYEELYHEFLHKVDLTTPNGTASILDALVAYESAKAVSGIKQSSKIFFKLNATLSLEWNEIRKKLGVD